MGLVLPKDEKITCLDVNKETSEVVSNFFKKANLDKKIKIILAPAIESLNNLKEKRNTFDKIFIEKNKEKFWN